VTAKLGLVPSILGLVPPFSNPSNKFDIYESWPNSYESNYFEPGFSSYESNPDQVRFDLIRRQPYKILLWPRPCLLSSHYSEDPTTLASERWNLLKSRCITSLRSIRHPMMGENTAPAKEEFHLPKVPNQRNKDLENWRVLAWNAVEEEFDATARVLHADNVRGIKFPDAAITRPGVGGMCHPKSEYSKDTPPTLFIYFRAVANLRSDRLLQFRQLSISQVRY